MDTKCIMAYGAHLARLKEVKRAGWLRYPQIQNVESVADHSWRVAMLVLALPQEIEVNRETCLRFALLHDLAESVVGDITPQDGVSPENKLALEKKGMQQIVSTLDPQQKDTLFSIWQDYERRDSPEALLVKDLDRYEMMSQALIYEQQYQVDLSCFYSDAHKVNHPLVAQWTAQLLSRRLT